MIRVWVADAALVCLSEQHPDLPVLSFDVYRRFTHDVLPRVRLPRIVQEPSPDYPPSATEASAYSPDPIQQGEP
jgi:hypothetical protein